MFEQMKLPNFFLMTFSIFTAEKIICVLLGHVFVMKKDLLESLTRTQSSGLWLYQVFKNILL